MSPEEKYSDEYDDLLPRQVTPEDEGYSPSYSSISLRKVPQHDRMTPPPFVASSSNNTTPKRRITLTVALVLISLLIITQRFWSLRRPLVENSMQIQLFDYIIVGSGPAGIIVASELARMRPDLDILLLEAGSASQTCVLQQLWNRKVKNHEEEECLAMRMPPQTFVNEFDIPLFWSGAATSEKHHWGIELLGKALGGSAIHNAMVYVRSLPSDWINVPGWSYSDIEKEYIALETYLGDAPDRASGTSGPMTTSSPVIHDSIAPLFVRAAENAGYTKVSSFNTNRSRSNTVGYYEFNIANGVRDSVAAAFLGGGIPANLIIETDATVTRVLLGLDYKAIGVEYVQGDTIDQAVLRKGGEVILSAGALLTPQLLHNSGFNFSYTVKDHPVVTVGFNVDSEMAADEAQSSLYLVGHELNRYHSAVEQLSNPISATFNSTKVALLRRQLGALGTPGFTGGAFLRSPWADSSGAPDIQLTVFPQQMEPHVVRKMKDGKTPAMLVTVALLQPDAVYQLLPSQSERQLINSKLPNDVDEDERQDWDRIYSYRLPKLHMNVSKENYLSDRDAKRLAWGIKQVRKIQETEPLSLHSGPEVFPATGYLLEHVRSNHLTNSHWVSSTPMGGSIVDERLRVSPSLRIVDAGVLPMVPNGNIHTTVCVVASRAVKLILEDRNDNSN